jgi:hypothetical protein
MANTPAVIPDHPAVDEVNKGGGATQLLKMCAFIYAKMSEEAQTVPADEYTEESTVWVGHLSPKFDEWGIDKNFYGYVTQCLLTMDCIERVQRGSARVPAVWRLVNAPTRRQYEATQANPNFKVGTSKKLLSQAEMQQRVLQYDKRIAFLTAHVMNLYDLLNPNKVGVISDDEPLPNLETTPYVQYAVPKDMA